MILLNPHSIALEKGEAGSGREVGGGLVHPRRGHPYVELVLIVGDVSALIGLLQDRTEGIGEITVKAIVGVGAMV